MRSAVVDAFCETVVPGVEGDPLALMGVSAVDIGVPERMSPETDSVLVDLLGADFASLGLGDRTIRLNTRVATGEQASYELRRLRAEVVALSYGLTEDGRNPLGRLSGTPDRLHRRPPRRNARSGSPCSTPSRRGTRSPPTPA